MPDSCAAYGCANRRCLEMRSSGITFHKVDHGERCLTPGKYACELTLDPNTANTNVLLSEDSRKATVVKELQPYPPHSDRYDFLFAVMCVNGLTGRCYWEVEREGWLSLGVAYRGIGQIMTNNDCRLGRNDKSWALFASDGLFSAWHNDKVKTVNIPPSVQTNRIGVYLDCHVGILSFQSLL